MLKFTLLRKSTHVRFICVFPPMFVPLRMLNFVPAASVQPGWMVAHRRHPQLLISDFTLYSINVGCSPQVINPQSSFHHVKR